VTVIATPNATSQNVISIVSTARPATVMRLHHHLTRTPLSAPRLVALLTGKEILIATRPAILQLVTTIVSTTSTTVRAQIPLFPPTPTPRAVLPLVALLTGKEMDIVTPHATMTNVPSIMATVRKKKTRTIRPVLPLVALRIGKEITFVTTCAISRHVTMITATAVLRHHPTAITRTALLLVALLTGKEILIATRPAILQLVTTIVSTAPTTVGA